jgi:hypothetical protein
VTSLPLLPGHKDARSCRSTASLSRHNKAQKAQMVY